MYDCNKEAAIREVEESEQIDAEIAAERNLKKYGMKLSKREEAMLKSISCDPFKFKGIKYEIKDRTKRAILQTLVCKGLVHIVSRGVYKVNNQNKMELFYAAIPFSPFKISDVPFDGTYYTKQSALRRLVKKDRIKKLKYGLYEKGES